MTTEEPIQATANGYRLAGDWTTATLSALLAAVAAVGRLPGGPVRLDASAIGRFDTSGALALLRLLGALGREGAAPRLEGLRAESTALLDLVRANTLPASRPPRRPKALERLGRTVWGSLGEGAALLGFLGGTVLTLLPLLLRPHRLRWHTLFSELEAAGVRAVPIVALLSFLLGVVIAYQGGVQLRLYGANIFIVDLVSLTTLRELAPMITAIIVAGRTGSAYTAEIGTMTINEEIDALRTLGIAPMELLVLPKVAALIIALPLLTMLADVCGLFGGMVMSRALLGVGLPQYLERLPEAVSLTSFLLGVCKTPVFAALVAVVGCFQGFRVAGSADSVGRQTTVSVVQSIFLVMTANAAFSVLFSALGL